MHTQMHRHIRYSSQSEKALRALSCILSVRYTGEHLFSAPDDSVTGLTDNLIYLLVGRERSGGERGEERLAAFSQEHHSTSTHR